MGGAGNDTVTLNEIAAATVQDTDLAGLSGIEALTFKGAFANSITLGGYAAVLLILPPPTRLQSMPGRVPR